MGALGDSMHDLVAGVRDHTLVIPAAPARVAEWPVVGKKIHGAWTQAHDDLPALIKNLQPKLSSLAKTALETVASIAVAILLFLASFIVAGIIMAFGKSGAASAEEIFDRIMGAGRGAEFVSCRRRRSAPSHSASSASRSSRRW
jgi:hypothetical protein